MRADSKMSDDLPIAVAMLSSGFRNEKHMESMKEHLDDTWVKVDLRKIIPRDPSSGGASHEQTCNHPVTIKAVYGSEHFVNGAP